MAPSLAAEESILRRVNNNHSNMMKRLDSPTNLMRKDQLRKASPDLHAKVGANLGKLAETKNTK